MKRWVLTFVAIGGFVLLVVSMRWWWKPLLSFVHINSSVIQGFAALLAIVVALFGALRLLMRLWRPNKSPVEQAFEYRTKQAIAQAQLKITGLSRSFERSEVGYIEDQLKLGKPVVLTGDAGSGKTGIAALTAKKARRRKKRILVLDALRVQHVADEAGLRTFFSATEPLVTIIMGLAKPRGFRLVIDQLDNTIGLPVSRILIELACDCSGLRDVEVVVISRKKESHESRLLQKLISTGFVELESRELRETEAEEALKLLGINDPSADLISLCRNLLNLEIVATIKKQKPTFDFRNVMDEVAVWGAYLEVLHRREEDSTGVEEADRTMSEAIRLARYVLSTDDQVFMLDHPSASHRRLISWGMILNDDGYMCRFKHEKLQDFLYSRDAVDRGLMPDDVMNEIHLVRSRNVMLWMDRIYASRNSPRRAQFVREMFNAQ